MKKFLIFNFVILLLIGLILVTTSSSRIQDFHDYHLAIAQESTASTKQAISQFISEKKRLVQIFGNDHEDVIKQLAADPANEELYAQLESRIKIYFPDYFAFTIADAQGKPFMEDFDGLIGELCQNDLRKFTQTQMQLPRIHPHPDIYHFDVISRHEFDAKTILLFISFDADELGNMLENVQNPGHELMLIYPEASQLIEVTDKGARVNLNRNDYRLTQQEKARILVTTPIDKTRWSIIDMHRPELFSRYENNIRHTLFLIFSMFLIISAFMLVVIRRQEQLRIAAENYKNDFLSIISHELRTPLTSIRGSLQLLQNDVVDINTDKGREMLDISVNNCERLGLLINDLLDLQKMEAGKMEYVIQPVELLPLLNRCITSSRIYAARFDCSVEFDDSNIDPQLTVMADAYRITQVMDNLLSNAIKYGAEQDTIEVSVTNTGTHVRINITDHGEGISEEFHDRLFEKFSQADATDTRSSTGTGLGLNIVKNIIASHQGTVSFTSQAGVGTTFWFEIPLA